ncbi:NADH dehydrogenase [Coprinopsis cinerea okayama7|uniref:NADH dehydrogenase n=1 Tax=Coprinopsis cinerea (strain Okayama-7 / 130 / ATCC MYA-4618 / FGSC 9003) TaxID=240176 RepID=A8N2R5_COPC7|nr:NADH dehydrogenase [Coprinopsis cinerea okayama7\|eukprot:XP_001829137.2 NADH dehydrogenase [Coprinopsis cinerea okayama7\
MKMASKKIVLCGAGFIGKHIAKCIASNPVVPRRIQLSSRNPTALLETLQTEIPSEILSAVPVDITKPGTLQPAFEDAHTVVSMVGLLHGSLSDFEKIQVKGAENAALAAKEAGARLIHFSAIGADATSDIAYAKTKALGERAVREACPDATIIRPSLVFGPEDDFFNRFAKLSAFLPFLPVFNDGTSKFQPVYAGDLGKGVELMTRGDPAIEREISGKILEAGGPTVHDFRQLMAFVLKYIPRTRPIISLPLSVGMVQAAVMEKLPVNLFTITRDQIKQLQLDNVVNPNPGPDAVDFHDFLWKHLKQPPTSLHTILPSYLS